MGIHINMDDGADDHPINIPGEGALDEAEREITFLDRGMRSEDVVEMEEDRRKAYITVGATLSVEELISRQRERITARQVRGRRPSPYPVSEEEMAIRRPTRLMGDEELRRQYGFDVRENIIDDLAPGSQFTEAGLAIERARQAEWINARIRDELHEAQNSVISTTTNGTRTNYVWVNDSPNIVEGEAIPVNDSPNVVNDVPIGVNGSNDSDFVVKQPKMDVTIDPLFSDFLKGNRMFKEFVEEWSNPANLAQNLTIWDRSNYISGSFDWSKTERGHSYWSSLSTVWRTVIHSLGKGGEVIPEEVKKSIE